MKFIALDVGSKRIGVASCDRLEIAASPHSVIPAGRNAPAAVARLLETEEADGIVIGLPLSLDGSEHGEASRIVRAFVERLQPLITVPLELVDERFTTNIAVNSLIEAGMRREKRRDIRDAVSAALILKSFLDRRRSA
ncbi:MAG TPA: Holliday junction resolvase RuvX [Candidatus Ozemobacteraceae bacterium]|nr:Holliday junction resolvase RuvX [Candidatus Ozemobacteraceae bacterium]